MECSRGGRNWSRGGSLSSDGVTEAAADDLDAHAAVDQLRSMRVAEPADATRRSCPGGVIHFSTATSVHSSMSADQRVYSDHPQSYPQDATLAGPGLA